MPVARLVANVVGERTDRVTLLLPPEYRGLWGKALARIRAAEEKRDDLLELEVVIEWHLKKRTIEQLRLFWVLIGTAASLHYGDGYRLGPGEAKEEANRLYEDFLEERGPRVECVLSPEAEAAFLDKFYRVVSREEYPSGKIRLECIMGASQWNIKQASEAIDYWFNELATLGVPDDVGADLASYWREWRTYLDKEGVRIVEDRAEITTDEYKRRTPMCEGCGCWLGMGGHLAHIDARGMGGNEEAEKSLPGDWLHLCERDHLTVQHQKGWGEFLKRFPWNKGKVEAALKRSMGE